MKARIFFFCLAGLVALSSLWSQEGVKFDFNDGILQPGWETSTAYTLTPRDSLLEMACKKRNWDGQHFNFPVLDMQDNPYLSMDIRASHDCSVMIWVYDSAGFRNPVSHFIPAGDSLGSYVFDFTGMFANYTWNNRYTGSVDFSAVSGIHFDVNPGGIYNRMLELDNIALGDSAIAPAALSGSGPYLDTVEILIHPDSLARLDSHPTTSDDVHGGFVDGAGVSYGEVELHYRGASNLLGLIGSDKPQRNWKVKVPRDQLYRNRREWNLNYSLHVRQEMAYHLFKKAGVPCISTRHVNLRLNGEDHGLYLEYEDPDNKPWLEDMYGDDSGDLYKAALDVPNEPSYFAELTYLGPRSEDYFLHYRKKTNHKVAPEDYTSVRDLIIQINFAPNESFIDSLERYFDTEAFISYLVVSNFISNWDGYPHRGKNYWLYQDPARDHMFSFIPWDLDNTLQIQTHDWNRMGTHADLFYQFDRTVWAGHNPAEVYDRPLIRRMMRFAQYRNAYINRYKEALGTFLRKEQLLADLDSLDLLIRQNSDNYQYQIFHNTVTTTKVFAHQRTEYTGIVLDTLTYADTVDVTHPVLPYPDLETRTTGWQLPSGIRLGDPWPNPNRGSFSLWLRLDKPERVSVQLYDLNGRKETHLYDEPLGPGEHVLTLDVGQVTPGIYILQLSSDSGTGIRRMVIQ